jgi:hypothetical protein
MLNDVSVAAKLVTLNSDFLKSWNTLQAEVHEIAVASFYLNIYEWRLAVAMKRSVKSFLKLSTCVGFGA